MLLPGYRMKLKLSVLGAKLHYSCEIQKCVMPQCAEPDVPKSPKIRECFPYSGSIREEQEKALATIEHARTGAKKFVVLELPTGTGKSALAMAASKWASDWGKGAYILSPQKQLTGQYIRDFARHGLVELRGRSSYLCADFKTNCEIGVSLRGKNDTACLQCPYKRAKDHFVAQKMGVTNFDYFLAETLYSGQLPQRSVLIVDEAHNLEQKVLSFTDFEISPFALQKYSVAIPTINDGDTVGACQWIQKDVMPAVESFISKIPADDVDNAENRRDAESLLRRMRRFIRGNQREWVCWSDQRKFSFRPLSATKYAHDFLFSRADMIIIMSATILDFDVFCRTLGLQRGACECLELPSSFALERRPIFFRPLGPMSYSHKDKTLPKVVAELNRLLALYSKQKGLIHTNSYSINDYLIKALRAAGHGRRIVTHGPGGAEEAIRRHREGEGPTVLFSPSMTEGLDLPHDLSRFQVVVKVPYPNLKDPYVAARKKLDERWYVWKTAVTLVQATGRSIRSERDFADTYILDQDFDTFRKRSRNLLPRWWLDAIVEPEKSGTDVTVDLRPDRPPAEPNLF